MGLLDEIAAAQDKLAALPLDTLTPTDVLDVLECRERLAWQAAAFEHRLIHRLTQCDAEQLGGDTAPKVLRARLRISLGEAKRRVGEAADLGPRTTFTGQPLEPTLPNVAAGLADGRIGPEHVRTIRKFFAQLPVGVDLDTQVVAEEELARHAQDLGPEEFKQVADRLLLMIDQDGTYNDAEVHRRRGITLGKQGSDGLTRIDGWPTPEARAVWEAIWAKLAAPGMSNADDDAPCVEGAPTEDQIKTDLRTTGQRQHDAFVAAGRVVLASKKLGNLNGLPVTVIVSTTLKELESGAGHAVTAGGTMLPMRDLIRLASHAHHYLTVFDDHGQALHLGRSKRIASPAQRIVMYARDRGCSAPGCTVPAYLCQAHHADQDWADGGNTDIDQLTLACGPDNRKATAGGWKTRIRADGRCEWIPPPHLDSGTSRVNNYHHPEHLLIPDDDGG